MSSPANLSDVIEKGHVKVIITPSLIMSGYIIVMLLLLFYIWHCINRIANKLPNASEGMTANEKITEQGLSWDLYTGLFKKPAYENTN